MPNSDEYYRILGVEKSCTDNEIKAAFRKKVKQVHPDNSANNGDAEIDNGQMPRLIEARDWLLKNRSLGSNDNNMQFQWDLDNNYFYKSDKTKWFQEEQQKEKRKNLKIKITKTLNKIKNWDLRGIKLCANKQIVGEIIDQKIERFYKAESIRVCVLFKEKNKRWVGFVSILLEYELVLRDKDAEKQQKLMKLKEWYRDLKTLS